MIRKFVLCLSVAGVLLAPLALAAGPQPKVQKLVVRPTRIAGGGGTIRVRARVSMPRGRVDSVRAQGSVTGGAAGPVTVLNSRANIYEGEVAIPRNSKQTANTATVMLYISTNTGQFQRIFARLRIDPGDDAFPPDPPRY